MGAVNGQRELGVDGREICRVDDGPYRSAMGTTGSGAVGHRLPHGCSAVSPRSAWAGRRGVPLPSSAISCLAVVSGVNRCCPRSGASGRRVMPRPVPARLAPAVDKSK